MNFDRRFSFINEEKNTNAKYDIITVFDGMDAPVQYDLSAFRKNIIKFGRDVSCDIKLKSKIVSREHGYFILDEHGVTVEDAKSLNGIILNGVGIRRSVFREGDILRIDDALQSIKEGVLILLSAENNQSDWKYYSLAGRNSVSIGRRPDCSINLRHVGVSKLHATIRKDGAGYSITDEKSTNGVFVNGQRIYGTRKLEEKDIILITNTKLIFTSSGLFYCSYISGIGIEARNIVKTVKSDGRSLNICNDVSLTIKPGELVAIIGGSGAGKTTLMNAISGYCRPTSGEVFVNGEELYDTFGALKSIIGYVPQQDILYDSLTLETMLTYAAKLRLPDDTTVEERNLRVESVIRTVELVGKEKTLIRKLSGGQKKRASIAVELISDPYLFFLDEPASGLDPGTERNLMKTLKKMTADGKTIVLVTHSTLNLQDCDEIVFMGKGGNLCYYGNMKKAEEFFNVSNLVDVYNYISDDPITWRNKYDREVASGEPLKNFRPVPGRKKAGNKHSALRQIAVLTERYLQLLINDRQRLMLLLLQAPLLAFLISLVKDGGQFEKYGITKSLLFAFSCSAFWVGTLNAIQEVCKERNILHREYMTGLRIGSYVLSKFIGLGLLCFIQSGLLTGVFVMMVGKPNTGVFLNPVAELFITTFLTSYSAAGMGLLASSFFKNEDRAMTVAPILLMPQILFSGLLFELKGVTKIISWFAICRWSMEGYGSTADLNSLSKAVTMNGKDVEIEHKAEMFFDFTKTHMLKTWMILLLFVIAFGIMSCIALRSIRKNA